MTSKTVHQLFPVYIRWNYVAADADRTTFPITIKVPFLVDEVRVAKILVTASNNVPADPSLDAVVYSDLLQGITNQLGYSRIFVAGENTAGGVISSAQMPPVEGTRVIFGPGYKRNVNGTFMFELLNADNDRALSYVNLGTSSVNMHLEFIQYEEDERVKFDSDLQMIQKSGRRRV
jgi:hypothetical protein